MSEQQSRHVDVKLVAWLAIVAAAVLVTGLVLIAAGQNNILYSSDPAVQGFWGIITQAGDELFFIVVISFLFFGADKVFGRKLLYGFLINTHVNALGKAIFKDPRPVTNGTEDSYTWWEEGYGFPSGHSQSSVAFWGYSIAATRGRTYSLAVKIAGAALLALVPISRLVLGVHDVQDITGGFVIGVVVLLVYLFVEEHVLPRVEFTWTARIAIGVAAWMTLWVASLLALPDSADSFGQPCGLLVGMAIGLPIEAEKIKYDPASLPVVKRVLSGIIGSLLTIGTYFVLSFTIGKLPVALYIGRFIRYAALGLIVSLVFTWLLKKITAR